jgi:hypothetical protein
MDNAIKILLDAGYTPHGETHFEVVRIITQKSYPNAGATVKSGGRLRFEKGKLRATVGKRTVCLYEVIDGQARNMQNYSTSEFSKAGAYILSNGDF